MNSLDLEATFLLRKRKMHAWRQAEINITGENLETYGNSGAASTSSPFNNRTSAPQAVRRTRK